MVWRSICGSFGVSKMILAYHSCRLLLTSFDDAPSIFDEAQFDDAPIDLALRWYESVESARTVF